MNPRGDSDSSSILLLQQLGFNKRIREGTDLLVTAAIVAPTVNGSKDDEWYGTRV